jgi:hypothetical protein
MVIISNISDIDEKLTVDQRFQRLATGVAEEMGVLRRYHITLTTIHCTCP